MFRTIFIVVVLSTSAGGEARSVIASGQSAKVLREGLAKRQAARIRGSRDIAATVAAMKSMSEGEETIPDITKGAEMLASMVEAERKKAIMALDDDELQVWKKEWEDWFQQHKGAIEKVLGRRESGKLTIEHFIPVLHDDLHPLISQTVTNFSMKFYSTEQLVDKFERELKSTTETLDEIATITSIASVEQQRQALADHAALMMALRFKDIVSSMDYIDELKAIINISSDDKSQGDPLEELLPYTLEENLTELFGQLSLAELYGLNYQMEHQAWAEELSFDEYEDQFKTALIKTIFEEVLAE